MKSPESSPHLLANIRILQTYAGKFSCKLPRSVTQKPNYPCASAFCDAAQRFPKEYPMTEFLKTSVEDWIESRTFYFQQLFNFIFVIFNSVTLAQFIIELIFCFMKVILCFMKVFLCFMEAIFCFRQLIFCFKV